MNNAKTHILVGIDFSDSSNMALSHAVRMAEAMGARLHLAHISKGDGMVADTNLGMNIPSEFPEAREARIGLQRVLAQLGSGIDGEVHVRMGGSPIEGMLSLIKEIKPDFVVVCSHGKGLLRRAMMGSVSNQLVQRSPVPVVVVPTPGREQILNQPEPPKEPELPSVGRAVVDSAGGIGSYGISGVGGGDITYR